VPLQILQSHPPHLNELPTTLREESAIADAVLSGNVDRAARVSDEHIRYTLNTVGEIRHDEERLEASLRRLDRSDLLSSSDGDA
jgi:GntR family transcriptional regulator, transcriptional repressor for pyruvate dehydrogenase complex